MKTTMRQLATGTILAFLLLTGNANAHGTAVKHTCCEKNQATLQLKGRMADEFIREVNSVIITEETEYEQVVENWMVKAETWDFNSVVAEETEAGLTIEDWMTDLNVWVFENVDTEPELSLELWMIDTEIWK